MVKKHIHCMACGKDLGVDTHPDDDIIRDYGCNESIHGKCGEKLTSDLPDVLKKQPYITTRESEINSIFIEELYSSADFQDWVLKKMSLDDTFEFDNAWKSFHPKPGTECDIAVRFVNGSHSTILLIENKIDASEQPDQAKRYHQSGEYLVNNKTCDEYKTCLLCPNRYDKDDSIAKKYIKKISYEELLEWFKKQPDSKRLQHKQMIVENGIERARTGYTQVTDENTTNFHNFYREIANKLHPDLKLGKGSIASSTSWIHIKHGIFTPNIKIVYKGKDGYVDLQISKIDKDEFFDWCKDKKEDKMSLHDTGMSVSVRLDAPKISKYDIANAEEPEKYREEIVESLQSAKMLKNWYVKWRDDPIFAPKF